MAWWAKKSELICCAGAARAVAAKAAKRVVVRRILELVDEKEWNVARGVFFLSEEKRGRATKKMQLTD
jgi:hypothetical protein